MSQFLPPPYKHTRLENYILQFQDALMGAPDQELHMAPNVGWPQQPTKVDMTIITRDGEEMQTNAKVSVVQPRCRQPVIEMTKDPIQVSPILRHDDKNPYVDQVKHHLNNLEQDTNAYDCM